jgi:hypothetical protein
MLPNPVADLSGKSETKMRQHISPAASVLLAGPIGAAVAYGTLVPSLDLEVRDGNPELRRDQLHL